MKIKDGFMLRELADQWIVVPVGSRVIDFNGIMTLSSSGAILWKKLGEGTDENGLVNELLNVYDIDELTARNDVNEFVTQIEKNGIIE